MKAKLSVWIIVMLLLVSLAFAQVASLGTFKQNICIDLIQVCSNCTSNNISKVLYPNTTIVIDTVEMGADDTFFNYTTCNATTIIGTYLVYGYGDLDGVKTTWGYSYEVTQDGFPVKDNTGSLMFLAVIILGLGSIAMWILNRRGNNANQSN